MRTRISRHPRPAGQSMVEMVLIFPLIMLLIAGMIQVAFVGNSYMTVLDASRAGARFSSDGDPFFVTGDSDCATTTDFYYVTACLTLQNMTDLAWDNTTDDIVVSVFELGNSGNVLNRYPLADGDDGWSLNGNHDSEFTTAEIQSRLSPSAPATGIVLVEVFFAHHHIFQLPVGQQFLPDPVELRAFTIMPLIAAEPTPTP